MNEISNAELKLIKKAKKSNISSFRDNELKLCKLLHKKGYLVETLEKIDNKTLLATYKITNKGIIYLESKTHDKIEFFVSKIVIPLVFFLLGVISTNFDKISKFILNIIPHN